MRRRDGAGEPFAPLRALLDADAGGAFADRAGRLGVRLLDGDGAEIPLAFVEVPHGLWDPARRRLTLFIHPGRIKRGVAPREVMGPVLVPGETVTLRLDDPDLDDPGLGRPFEARFTVGADDRRAPDSEAWTITPPSSPDGPLVVRFDEPLDPALARRMLAVVDTRDRRVDTETDIVTADGCLAIGADITPARPWRRGAYALAVDPALEDLAGHRVGALFEQALVEQALVEQAPQDEPTDAPLRLAFSIQSR